MKSILIIFCTSLLISTYITLFDQSPVTVEISKPLKKLTSAVISPLPAQLAVVSEAFDPSPEPLSQGIVLAGINDIRGIAKIPELKIDSTICPLAVKLLTAHQINTKQLASLCPNCTQAVSATFDKRTSLPEAIQYIENGATASAILKSRKLNLACLQENESVIILVAAQKVIPASPLPQRIITEDELFLSLAEYRRAQGMSELSKDDRLCDYARKRVDDHIRLLDEKTPKSTYPNPDKYPLDAHDGFKKDADSGLVFDMTQKSEVAENLAYWPNAQYAAHVIEWGWDSSTEGHRETQLSNNYSSACLSGKQGFFVAIFGK